MIMVYCEQYYCLRCVASNVIIYDVVGNVVIDGSVFRVMLSLMILCRG